MIGRGELMLARLLRRADRAVSAGLARARRAAAPAAAAPARRWKGRSGRIRDVARRGRSHPNVLRRDDDLRSEARAAYRQAYPGRRAPVEVHHRVPLEWRFLFPDADPNRLANLQGLSSQDHRRKASDLWDAFRAAHQRRRHEPTPAEVLDYAMLVDRSLNLPYPLP